MLAAQPSLKIEVRALERISCTTGWLKLVKDGPRGVELHVVLESVTSVESLRTEVTRKGHLPAVYEHVLFQVMLHSKSLGALTATKRP